VTDGTIGIEIETESMSRQGNEDSRAVLEAQALQLASKRAIEDNLGLQVGGPLKKKQKKNEFFGKEDDLDEMKRKIDTFVFQEDRVHTMRKKNAAAQQSKQKKIIGDDGQEYEEKVIFKKGKRIVVRKRVGNISSALSKDKEPRYLDRAALRRNGANAEMIAEEFEKIRGMSAEESRYVGGDISHTHWVKGLDYVLLDKVGIIGLVLNVSF